MKNVVLAKQRLLLIAAALVLALTVSTSGRHGPRQDQPVRVLREPEHS